MTRQLPEHTIDLMPGTAVTLSALGLNGLGVAICWWGWYRRDTPQRGTWAVGLGVLLLALWVWWRHTGVEFGTLYWCGATALCAWCTVAMRAETGAARTTTRPFRVEAWSAHRLAGGAGTLLLAGPLTLLTSTIATLLIARSLPLHPANGWIIAAFLLPLLWATLAVWVVCSERRPRVALANGVLGAIGALLLYATTTS